MSTNTKKNNKFTQKLQDYLQKNYNVLFIGTHGIGKTASAMEAFANSGRKMKYFSSPTLDPHIDVIGVPVPNREDKTIEFFRTKDLDDADGVFFDELNRAHPRILNAVFELIQFKSINGKKFPNLKTVWAAINPPGENYQVDELDPALVDRFHVYVNMKPAISVSYLSQFVEKKTAQALAQWWDVDCTKEHRAYVTPRRMEYMARLINDGLDWEDALVPGMLFPKRELNEKLRAVNGEVDDNFVISKEIILSKPEVVLERIKQNPNLNISVHRFLLKLNPQDVFKARDIIEALPAEMLASFAQDKYARVRGQILREFVAASIDTETKYPNMHGALNFGEQRIKDLAK